MRRRTSARGRTWPWSGRTCTAQAYSSCPMPPMLPMWLQEPLPSAARFQREEERSCKECATTTTFFIGLSPYVCLSARRGRRHLAFCRSINFWPSLSLRIRGAAASQPAKQASFLPSLIPFHPGKSYRAKTAKIVVMKVDAKFRESALLHVAYPARCYGAHLVHRKHSY